jgi:hypothetical protein
MTLTIGQKLWFVPDRRSGMAREVTVSKIGRKWASLDTWGDLRIDVSTLQADGRGYSSPGRCYFSHAAWEAEVALDAAWTALWRDMHDTYRRRDGVTVENIQAARKLLNLDACRSGVESRNAPSIPNADDATEQPVTQEKQT